MYVLSQSSHLLLQKQPGVLVFQSGQLSLLFLVMLLENDSTKLAEETFAAVA